MSPYLQRQDPVSMLHKPQQSLGAREKILRRNWIILQVQPLNPLYSITPSLRVTPAQNRSQ